MGRLNAVNRSRGRLRWAAGFNALPGLQPPARLGSGPVRTGRLLLARHRRPLTVALVLALLWITLRSALPAPPATVAVLVAARDLPAGRTLMMDDLRTDRRPAQQAPGGTLTVATGRTLATPVRRGEPITDTRVVGPGLLLGQPLGTVAVPVRLGDPAAADLARPGDRVDLLAASPSSALSSEDATGYRSAGEPLATRALVLAAPAADDDGSTGPGSGLGELAGGALSGPSTSTGSGLLVLAVSTQEARRLAAAQSGQYLAIAVRP